MTNASVRLFDAARVQAPYLPSIRSAMAAVLDSSRYILGPAVAQFEQEFAAYCGTGFAIGVGNGSDALELALRAVDVGSGSRVITVANAGGYASTAISACGAQPVYAEIDDQRLLLDPDAVAPLLQMRPQALILTHLYGQMAAVGTIAELCAEHGVALIEDCAQAHGAEREGRRAGSFGAIGCFSFYPTKNLGAIGDGGALVTSDAVIARRLLALRQYGWSSKYRVELAHGRNSRLDELQAAILSAKLPGLDTDNARRREIARRYGASIRHRDLQLPEGRGGSDDVAHLYVIRCARREALRAHLSAHGIDSDVHYPIPDHRQPAWEQPLSLPISEQAARKVLSLPCHPALSDEEVQRVVDALNCFA